MNLKKRINIKLKRFQTNVVRNILLNKKDIIILRVYRNYLKILKTTKTFYNSFNGNKKGLVKIRKNFKLFKT